MMFDCIIVGAGPAGGTAAYHLAKRGHSVVVIEKAALPRYKPCGGGVSPAIAQWFDFDFTPAIAQKVDTIRYTWKMDDPVEVELQTAEPMWMVQRDVFDHFLIKQAQQQGAELRDGTEVTGVKFVSDHWQVNTSNGPVEGRYLIAADGAQGPMAKWLGFKDRKSRLGAVVEVSSAGGDRTAHFEFGMVKNGYIWNFPKAEGHTLSIGTFRGGEPKPQELERLLNDYARQFNGGSKLSQYQPHALCLWEGGQKLHTQNAVLAGEAACTVDPFTGEGIRPSVFSGLKASEAIHSALAGESNALERYTQAIADEWGSDMVWAQRLAGVFYRIPGIGYKVGVKRPYATQEFSKILCGEMQYADVAGRALKRLSGSLIPGMG